MADPKQKSSNRRVPSAKKKSIISDNFVISRNATPLKAMLDAAENPNLDSVTAVPQYRSTAVLNNIEAQIPSVETAHLPETDRKEITEELSTAVPQYRSTAVLNNLIEPKIENLDIDSKLTQATQEIKQVTAVPQYRSTAVPQNVSSYSDSSPIPTNNFYKKPNQAVDKIDRNLSPAESKVLDHLLRLSIGFNKSSCQVRVSTLQERTGYRSDKTVREALNGLITKGLISRQSHHNSPLGDHYRILLSSNNEMINLSASRSDTLINSGNDLINSGSLRSEALINSGSDLINSGSLRSETLINSGSDSGRKVPEYSGTSVKNTAVLESKITGHLNTYKDNDDDDFVTLLKDLFPNLDQEDLDKTIKETHQLLALELKKRLQHSKSNPVSPNYIVECIRRLCSPSVPTSKKPRHKEQLRKVIDTVMHTNVGKNLSLPDLIEDVKRACARDNVAFDTDLFNELISAPKN